jgi:hypothetical protein
MRSCSGCLINDHCLLHPGSSCLPYYSDNNDHKRGVVLAVCASYTLVVYAFSITVTMAAIDEELYWLFDNRPPPLTL